MALFTASGKALATAASTNVVSLRSGASAGRAKLREVAVFSEAATALNLALFRTTVVDTAGTGVTVQPHDAGDGSSCTVVTGPTGGTLAAVAQRRAFLPAVIGSAVIWTWLPGGELIVPLALSVVLRNDVASAGPAITWYMTWDE